MVVRRDVEERIRGLVRRMHAHVDAAFQEVIALLEGSRKVDEEEFDRRLIAVEEVRRAVTIEALLLIARWQPLGEDLARAESYIRVSYDLFRISRYLREVLRLEKAAGPLKSLGIDITPLKLARDMVRKAVDSMLAGDEKLAEEVEKVDSKVDEYYLKTLERLSRDPVPRREAVEALLARHVERIADHATYIARLARPGRI
ncbi:MAG: PhoU domain-containing protein [Thermoproteota archaeon]